MRVVFGGYPSNRWSAGGKERLLRDAADELRRLGVDVELLDPWDWDDDGDIDVLHLWGSEYYQHEMGIRAKARGARLVVTSILVYPTARVERLTRYWRHVDRLVPMATSYSLRRDLLRAADRVVCFATDELAQVHRLYGVPRGRLRHIPISASPAFRTASPELFHERIGIRDAVLSVARIEPRKNTLALVRAARDLGLPLVLLGAMDPAHADYCEQVGKELASLRTGVHLPAVPTSDPLLASAYSAARVHALVSFSEQTGVANLEAGLAGANLVVSDLPSTREAFRDFAWYADPHDDAGIRDALGAAYAAPLTTALADHLEASCSTTAVAGQLRDLYVEVCSDQAAASSAVPDDLRST